MVGKVTTKYSRRRSITRVTNRINKYMRKETQICPRLIDYNNLKSYTGPITFDDELDHIIFQGKQDQLEKANKVCLGIIFESSKYEKINIKDITGILIGP